MSSVYLPPFQVHWSGVNWNGFDSMNCVVDGLWGTRTIGSHLDQMVSLGFNLIRLGFATTCLMDENAFPAPESINYDANPELQVYFAKAQIISAPDGK